MCGVSSGFASVFGLEVATLVVMNYEALIPCCTASIVSNLVTVAWGIHHAHYKILEIPRLSYIIVIKIIFVAILFGLTYQI